MSYKKITIGTLIVIAVFILFRFYKNSDDMIKVGVTAGPHAQIMRYVQSKNHLKIKIIEFNDFILPNVALNDGDIDVNCYQHEPFLMSQNKDHGWNLIPVGKTILLPMGIYSSRYKSLNLLPKDALVSIPNDPTNASRALLLLEKAGLLTLSTKMSPNLSSITSKNIKIKEIEAPMQSRSLVDVDAAVINTDWVIVSSMDPKQAIFKEDADSPYTNILVSCQNNFEKAKQLLSVYQTDDVKEYIKKTFKGTVFSGW